MGIQSIERAIDILKLLSESRSAMGLPEISAAMGLPKTTIHTIVKTMRDRGFLRQDPDTRHYRLGLALYELGAIQAAELEINRFAFQPLQELANVSGQICRLGLWDRQSVLIISTVHPHDKSVLVRQLGPRIPAYCSALGKAILSIIAEEELARYLATTQFVAYTPTTLTNAEELRSNLQKIRAQGFSISQGELISHQIGLGAPVRGKNSQAEAAISMQMYSEEFTDEIVQKKANQLIRTAHEISMAMGYQPLDAL